MSHRSQRKISVHVNACTTSCGRPLQKHSLCVLFSHSPVRGRRMHHTVHVLSLFPSSHFMFTSGTSSPDSPVLYEEFLIDHNVQSSTVRASVADVFFLKTVPRATKTRASRLYSVPRGAAGCDHQHARPRGAPCSTSKRNRGRVVVKKTFQDCLCK